MKIYETKIIIEGKIAEIFALMPELDSELRLELIKDIRKRIEKLR